MITYQELLEQLMTLPEEQLQRPVMFIDGPEVYDVGSFLQANDPEIFEYTDELLDPDQMVLKSTGITHILDKFGYENADPTFLRDDEEDSPDGDDHEEDIEAMTEEDDQDGTVDS